MYGKFIDNTFAISINKFLPIKKLAIINNMIYGPRTIIYTLCLI